MDRKIRVVRMIARLNIGGPAIHTILLADGIDKAAFETHLVKGAPEASEGSMLELAEKKAIEIEYIPQLGREICFRDIAAFVKIWRSLVRIRPDIVHTHTAKAGTLGRVAAVLAGVPVRIHTFHGHIFDGYFSPLKTRCFMAIEKVLAVFTDKVIVVSKSVREQIVDKLKIVPDGKCVVVKLGFELEKFLNNDSLKGALKKELGIGNDTLLVGIVGRLVPIKNHEMFLEAVRKLREIRPGLRVKFLIIGDGESRRRLEEKTRSMGLEGHIIFTGWIKEIANAYADLDVAALTSLNEGTPVSLIEAMASARPVVATSVGGVGDIVFDGENGLLVGSNDAGAFAGALSVLLNDPGKREAMGLKGREFARNNFRKERLIGEIEALYHACLETKRGGRKAEGRR